MCVHVCVCVCVCHSFHLDLKSLQKSGGKFGIAGGPRGDNLFLWDVELSDFEKGTLLYKDLEAYAKKYKRKVCEGHRTLASVYILPN